ncbi:MAG TPA: hypothetical protein DCO83_15450 [Mucilaginibacter sp.]|jgi:hypothetical protein|nr:hypothetical protein [Mucilaginibacter sp.]
MKQLLFTLFILAVVPKFIFAQHSDENRSIRQLQSYEDSLVTLGKQVINNDTEMERINANQAFIKTLVNALKIPNSFLFLFDSVKSVSIINSPDNRFRIISWPIVFDDGSYRFYGTVQMNTGGKLLMFPLSDFSASIKSPEDTVNDNHKWFGAEYYRIIPVYSPKLYYVLLGWKGNTIKSTKKVIEILSFKDDKPVLGMPVFEGNGKTRKRVVFEYTRQASMLLRYVPEQDLIVFDHLTPPDPKLKEQRDTYGPDLTYDGYKLKNGRWVYIDNLDMRNVPDNHDANYIDPKKQAEIDRAMAKKE